MKSKLLFIVNPISGTGKQNNFTKVIDRELDKNIFDYNIEYTQYKGHATTIAAKAISNYDYVVAVGGDGTVNEVAKGLINGNVIMGIIPVGSGNGLARHLQIPMFLRPAIQILNKRDVICIDTATINNEQFVNVAGIGFDAHVAHLYANTVKRGPVPYIVMATNEFYNYKPMQYQITIEGKLYTPKAFLISFANSAQFGNNAYISPHALINDGLIDVCILKEFPKVEAPQLAIKLFNKRLDKSRYMDIIRATKITIVAQNNIKGHIDGEPVDFGNNIDIKVVQSSLNMIYNTLPPRQRLLNQIQNLKNEMLPIV